jgi:hypothetical protein
MRLYKVGVVVTYEVQDIIEATSLKEAIKIAKKNYKDGFYEICFGKAVFREPKFYERYLKHEDIFKKETK